MAFEIFAKGSAPASTVPAVTIQKRGLFSINDAAYKLLREPAAVTFMWDKETKRIALAPTDPNDLNAYPARRQSPNKSSGPVLIAGTMFTRFIGLDTSTARRWTPRLEDGLLIIDLKEAGAEVISNRNRRAALDAHRSDEDED